MQCGGEWLDGDTGDPGSSPHAVDPGDPRRVATLVGLWFPPLRSRDGSTQESLEPPLVGGSS